MYNVTYECNVLCDRLPNDFFFFIYSYFYDSLDETCVNLWYTD